MESGGGSEGCVVEEETHLYAARVERQAEQRKASHEDDLDELKHVENGRAYLQARVVVGQLVQDDAQDARRHGDAPPQRRKVEEEVVQVARLALLVAGVAAHGGWARRSEYAGGRLEAREERGRGGRQGNKVGGAVGRDMLVA